MTIGLFDKSPAPVLDDEAPVRSCPVGTESFAEGAASTAANLLDIVQ